MFGNKKKIELTNEELRITRIALTNFRNSVLEDKDLSDPIDEVMLKLKSNTKVDKYDLGIIINGLNSNRKEMQKTNQDTSIINDLILKLIEISESFK